MAGNPKEFDIVLFGATGFAGKLTALYLAQVAKKESIRLALAGRNPSKLKELVEHIHAQHGVQIPEIVANVNHSESLMAMCKRALVVMSAAGPYVLYGEPVLRACLETGAHYLDITGEPAYVKLMWHKYHTQAFNSGLTVVHCCGFDSVPADAGAYRHCREIEPKNAIHIDSYVSTNATYSSGTIRSAIMALSREFDRDYGKDNHEIAIRPESPATRRIHYCTKLKRWALPMPVIDPWIVKRTAAGIPHIYGYNFTYAQYLLSKSLISLIRILFIFSAASVLLRIRPLRNAVMWWIKPGGGPSAQRRAGSRFSLNLLSTTPGKIYHTLVSGGDPGYDETAKMFAECAMCQLSALQNNRAKAGMQTPVLAWGEELEQRLRAAGISFQSKVGEGN